MLKFSIAAMLIGGNGRNGARNDAAARISAELTALAQLNPDDALAKLNPGGQALNPEQVAERLEQYGPNIVAQEQKKPFLLEIGERFVTNPINILLTALALITWFTGEEASDRIGAVIMFAMVVMAVFVAYFQEARSSNAVEQLRKMVSNTATAKREIEEEPNDGVVADCDDNIEAVRVVRKIEVPIDQLVPGDIVFLSAGDMVPADLRLIAAKDLFINQSALTGESMPVEKFAAADAKAPNALEAKSLCFMGSNVVSGSATAVVAATGANTYFGALAGSLVGQRVQTSFDKGVSRFAWLMIRFMAVMVPIVFLINGITKGSWFEAFMFAVAVAVGLTPEMLPMIVAINLAKGALKMAKKDVIVKRLNAIQNFGAIDVLCTDKTGTLTQDRVILERHTDIYGDENERVLEYAWLNSYHQTGLRNLLDVAVLEAVNADTVQHLHAEYTLVDEVPFDFTRRRMSVIVKSNTTGKHFIISKGAVAEMLAVCSSLAFEDDYKPLTPQHLAEVKVVAHEMNEDGFRALALGMREIEARHAYSRDDEKELTMMGFVAFLDPPKDSAAAAIEALNANGVAVKILTGDNDTVTRNVCRQVGIQVDKWLTGPKIEAMSDEELMLATRDTPVFARLNPQQKVRVVEALHRDGHVVGFMGDGINDGPALRAADVGISVDTAVDIAKESADIILLEKSLLVLEEGVLEGRKVFGNILKYIKMTASSNFGNMFSMIGASILLPFLPMLPVQILLNNLLYDFSQTAVASDEVDQEYLAKPRQWDLKGIARFMVGIGPVSSIFDYITFAVLWFVIGANTTAHASLFQTGWFIESLLSQTLIVHVIRTGKIPFLQSRASLPLTVAGVVICLVGILLTALPLGAWFGFSPLPAVWWPILAAILVAYLALTQVVKTWMVRRFGLL
ncbi:MAG: magnesium-translocating P-type ATPase [Proteobacteria bacterium]|uniref:magnesium-translocating P-type ATPase n=1 Tax=Rudaea sp. TaxID=2136325 RepID=UPI00322099E2|nr:magnesium-translocating P-type ATPase [Pseudomonadota bacterium]